MVVDKSREREKIARMFNSIAGSYDTLNHLLSFGIDKRWRSKLINKISSLATLPQKGLDLACGTGDVTVELIKLGIEVTGADLASQMLERAKEKCSNLSPTPNFVCCSAEELPFEDDYFDLITIAFGIRNFEERERALKEAFRVLKSGGYLMILEFAHPKNRAWRALFQLYFKKILPTIGRVISGDREAYRYLPASVDDFPQYGSFTAELEQAGFTECGYKSLTGGVALLYWAKKQN